MESFKISLNKSPPRKLHLSFHGRPQCSPMPLWLSSFRSLAIGYPNRILSEALKHQNQWQQIHRAWRNYSTALHGSLQDDSGAAPFHLSTESDSEYLDFVLEGYHKEPEETPKETSLHEKTGEQERASQPFRIRKYAAFRKYREKNAIRIWLPKSSITSGKRVLPAQQPHALNQPGVRRLSRPFRWRKSDTPAKFIPLKSLKKPSSRFSSVWNVQFAKITRRYDNKLEKDYLKAAHLPILDVRALQWVEDVLDPLDKHDHVALQEDAAFQCEKGHDWVWMQVALWMLAYEPQQMIRFLLATHVEPYVPATYIEDSLLHLSRHFAHSDDLNRARNMQQLADTFCVLAERRSKETLSFFNPFIRTLIPHCLDEQVHRLYQKVRVHKVHLHPFTFMHFATYFAKNDYFQQALDALLEARNVGANVNGYGFRSNCSTLLRRSIAQPGGLRVCLRVVSNLVDIGVKLDNPICDIIMLNAVEAGDLKTAFAVYRSLMERGLRPTESTFAVLLKGCKMNIDDVDMLNETIHSAIGNVNVRKSELVATEILHCLALHHSKHNPTTALNTLTEAYAQLFDLGPLLRLGLPIPQVSQKRLTAETLMPPTRHAITFLIGASIQHALSRVPHPLEILPLYERWRELVETGEPLIADLATTDHVSNIFLAAFIRTPSGLIHAARVVRDMQLPLPKIASITQSPPTVQTWSIFLHGFTRHGRTALAEQVLTYMRGKGIEPNQVTWNTLVSGYARAQDVEGTVEALRRLEGEGGAWDAWTFRGMGRLRARERLGVELRRERFERGMDFGGELRGGIGGRFVVEEGVGGVERGGDGDERVGMDMGVSELGGRDSYKPFGS